MSLFRDEMHAVDDTRTRGLDESISSLPRAACPNFLLSASVKSYGPVDIFVMIESGDVTGGSEVVGTLIFPTGVFLLSKRFVKFGFESGIGE
jgi:hypothetical protein